MKTTIRSMYRRINQKVKDLKYRHKMMAVILAAGLLSVAIITVYMQSGMTNLLIEKEVDNIEKSLDQAVRSIENQEQIYENLVDYLAYSEDLRTVLSTSLTSDYEMYVMYTDVVDPLLQMPQVYHKEIRGISLYSDNIKVPHGDTLLPLDSAGNQPWFADVEETTLMKWTMAREGSGRIVASRKFYDGNEIIAVLSMQLDCRAVLEPFINLIKDDMGGIILDSGGNVVYADHAISSEYEPNKPESLSYIKKNYTYSIREMESTGWKFCMYCPTKVISRSAVSLMLRNIPVVIGCIILLAVIGYFSSRRLVSRLELLTENMNQIHLGMRKVTVTSDAGDEVGVLIRSFKRMMDEMNRLISEVYESKIRLQNSEMKALVAQINPHFLYNSLSIINWKAIEAGEDEISKVTLALSTYYRTSLNRGETMTTIENELNNIRAYLRIQSVMHDGSFHVIEDVDMSVGDVQVPKLILQPLAENAIDHGLDISEKKEHILWISLRLEPCEGEAEGGRNDGSGQRDQSGQNDRTVMSGEENIIFEVRDNGVGMDAEKVASLLDYSSNGYGLRNVYERIKVLYGERGDVKVSSEPGKGTTVSIIIPRKTGAKLQ